jgi:glycogen synthase
MDLNLKKWQEKWGLVGDLFSPVEVGEIKEKLKRLEIRNVVYCSFESRFAKSGGLAAVTTRILPYLNELEGVERAILITPLYPHIIDRKKLEKTGIQFKVAFDQKAIKVDIYRYIHHYEQPGPGHLEEYYIKARGFFEARNRLNDPYIYHQDAWLNNITLLENALFFCKAVPCALEALGIRSDILFHLQEWQTSLIALTAKEALIDGTLDSCGCVQTMHNPYDCFVSASSLAKIVSPKRIGNIEKNPLFAQNNGLTAYQIGLQLTDGPVTTVSENFARELTTDIIHTQHFAPHLQEILKQCGIVGIKNGLFVNLPPEFSQHEKLTIEEIKTIKQEKRKALLHLLDQYRPSGRFGQLTYRSQSITHLPENIPIVVMSGRLDPVQKGYDILLRAIQRFAEDDIKVVLTPMPVRDSDLDYFREAAEGCRGNVTVFPIRLEKGYQELQMGSTFGLMPSIYEPFGAAVEYMVNGTVTISRATGGLKDQIDDRCGLLYREASTHYQLQHIKEFAASADRVQARQDNNWVKDMADALNRKLQEATYLYRDRPEEYYQMILEGFQKARTFDWQASTHKYFRVYQQVKARSL